MTPFVAALGTRLEEVEPRVRRHHASPEVQRFSGVVRIRSRGIAGRVLAALLNIGTWADVLRPARSGWIPFDLENEMSVNVMIWRRILHFPGARRRYEGRLTFKQRRILDSMTWLEVELDPVVEDGAVVMRSRRQWLRVGRARLPFPAWISAKAETREWAGDGPDLHLSLAIRSPLMGDLLGYEAVFRPVGEA